MSVSVDKKLPLPIYLIDDGSSTLYCLHAEKVEPGETHEQTALREVMEEAGVRATIVKYIGKSQYNFTVPEDVVSKEVHWYLMTYGEHLCAGTGQTRRPL